MRTAKTYFEDLIVYNFSLQVTGRVTHNVTKETALCSSPVMAEKDGFIELLQQAKECFGEGNLKSITTDANTQIRGYMKSDPVAHGLDVWHLCKNLSKNLTKKSTRKVSP